MSSSQQLIGTMDQAKISRTVLEPKFHVYKDSLGYYHVMDEWGNLQLATSYFSVAMNDQAFNGLSSRIAPQKISTKGEMSLDNTILLPSLVDLEIVGSWTAVNALNKDLIQNANQGTNNYSVYLHGYARINGNAENQGAFSSRGLEFKNATNIPVGQGTYEQFASALKMENLLFENCRNEGIFVDFQNSAGSTLGFTDVSSMGNHESDVSYQVYLNFINDSQWFGGIIGGSLRSFKLQNFASSKFHPAYVNNPAVIENCNQLDVHIPFFDLGQDADLLTINYSRHSAFYLPLMRVIGSGAAGTYDAVKLVRYGAGAGCIHNRFPCVYAGRGYGGSGTRTFKYAVEETTSDEDWNIYGLIDGSDCVSGAIRQLGTNGKPRANPCDSIIGTVILV